METRFRFGSFFVAFLFAYFLAFTNAHAQSNSGITIIPAFVEELAEPGATLNQTLKVTNESAEDKEYFIYKKNIKGVETGGVPIFADTEGEVTGYEISEWIVIPTEPLKVAAGASADLSITVNVPANATPGSHFGGVFVSAEPPKLRETGAGVGYEVASVFSIRVNGDISDDARIRSLSTDKLLYGSKDVHFTARIENQGNILIRPRGSVTISSMFSSEPVAVIPVNDSLAGVFPMTSRDIEFTWKEDGFGFGRYEAVLALSYDGEGGQKTIDTSHIFWVFPIKVMIGILVGLIILTGGGYALTRYYINRAIMHAGGGRRISTQRYRKQVGVSRFTFVAVTLMIVVVLFLLVLLVASA